MNSAFRIAAVVGFLGVALGAFGAHMLHDLLVKNNALDIWKTASTYHLVHAVVLLFVANQRPLPRAAWIFFLAGVVIFSGSLYLLAVTNLRWLGAVTPLGGFSFLAGWLWLAIRPLGPER
jgi:uncharacterized membrane protein YgdD (TMEM256/DUF423 family)